MSRMNKYLKQRVQLEQMVRNGEPVLDMYGEPQYQAPVSVPCRREKVVKDVQIPTGTVVRTDTRYYLGPEKLVDIGDKLDGKAIIAVEEYTNELGLNEGYLAYVA